MTLEETRKAFEGKDSAYLLVYRQLRVDNTPLINTGIEIPAPPEFWLGKALDANEKLRSERDAYEQAGGRKLDIQVLLPEHLESSQSPLFSILSNTGPLNFKVDSDKLIRDVLEELPLSTATRVTKSEMVLSRMNDFDMGLYILSPMDPKAPIAEAIYNQSDVNCGGKPTCYLLAWNGRDINGTPISSVGREGVPLQVPVHFVGPEEEDGRQTTIGFLWLQKSSKVSGKGCIFRRV